MYRTCTRKWCVTRVFQKIKPIKTELTSLLRPVVEYSAETPTTNLILNLTELKENNARIAHCILNY
jgi:hypothetical protein